MFGKVIPHTEFVIATVQRSGSYLLTEAFAMTGVAGNTKEWFNPGYARKLCEHMGLPFPVQDWEVFVHAAKDYATSSNGVFGFKCLSIQWTYLEKVLAVHPNFCRMSFPEAIKVLFPNMHYIRLIRKDRVRQAISFYRAKESNVWATYKKNQEAIKIPEYNEQQIIACEKEIQKYEDVWNSFIEQAGVTPFTVYYEDFVENYEGTVRDALEFMGIENAQSVEVPPPKLKKQADHITEEWVQRFLGFD